MKLLRFSRTLAVLALVCVSGLSAQVRQRLGGQLGVGGATYLQGSRLSVTITNPSLPGATVGVPYSAQLAASGGTAPYNFLIIAGVLPPGLSLDRTTGIISGVPAGQTQTYSALFYVQDSSLPQRYGARAYSITVTCTNCTSPPPTLQSITVNPTSGNAFVGNPIGLTAIGNYSDGSTKDLTGTSTWNIANTAVAAFTSLTTTENVTCNSPGTSAITATVGTITGSAALTCSAPAPITLQSIAVTPAGQSIQVGQSAGFTATGTFSDGTTQDITATVAWSSSSTLIATLGVKSATQAFNCIAGGVATISASLNGITSPGITLTCNAVLTSISVTPGSPSVNVGSAIGFIATGHYNDGSSQDVTASSVWSSNPTSVATKGVLSGNQSFNCILGGSATITAAIGSISGTTILTCVRQPVSIAVNPSNPTVLIGNSVGLLATATYSDGTQGDVTANATWTSSATSVVQVLPATTTEPATCVQAGNATITATFSGISGTTIVTCANPPPPSLLSIAITPSTGTVATGNSFAFTATGSYSDGSQKDVTSSAAWLSGNTVVASLGPASNPQSFNCLTAGTATVSATVGSIVGTASLTCTAPSLVSISVTPVNPSISVGTEIGFIATGTFSDGSSKDVTTSSTWTTSNSAVAPIGTLTTTQQRTSCASAGTSTITATIGTKSGSSTITCSASLQSIAITPLNPTVTVSSSISLVATGTFSDGTQQNVSGTAVWTSSNSDIAALTNATTSETVLCRAAGTATITAAVGSISTSTVVTCQAATPPPTLVSILVTPANSSSNVGSTLNYIATGKYSDNSTKDLTTTSLWSVSNASVATLVSLTTTENIKCATAGTVTVTASFNSIVGSTQLTCVAPTPTLVSIAVTPSNPTTQVGQTVGFIATGTFSDGSTQSLTSSATWASLTTSVATLGTLGTTQPATCVTAGTSAIKATVGAVSGQTTLTCTNPTTLTLQSIAVTPGNPTITIGSSLSFTATGTFSDGSTSNVTAASTWTVSNSAIVSQQLPDGVVGQSYSKTLTGTGTTPYTWTVPAATSSGKIDILDFATMPLPTRNTTHLVGTSLYKAYHVDAGLLWWIKNTAGNPWDGEVYDGTGFYHWFTEDGDSVDQPACQAAGFSSCFLDPSAYKKFVTPVKVAPRYFTLGGADVVIKSPSPNNYQRTTNCGADNQKLINLGNIMGITHDSGNVNWGGSVGTQRTIEIQYYWGIKNETTVPPQSGTRERYELAQNFGQVQWDTSHWNGTGWTVDQTTTQVTTAAGGAPTPNFACKVPNLTAAGNLPPGNTSTAHTQLNLADNTGVISGTPNLGGTYAFTVQQEDATGAFHLQNQTIRINTTATTAQQTLTCLAAGTVTLTATDGAVSGSTTVKCVTAPPTLQSIKVTPANPSINVGSSIGLIATGTFSDGSTQDLSTSAVWTSATTAVATIGASADPQPVNCLTAGSSVVTAAVGSISGTTTVTCVAPVTLSSITVTPANPTVNVNSSLGFVATCAFSDGSTKDCTTTSAWTSSATGVATVGAVADPQPVTCVAAGTSTIQATSGAIHGQTTITCQSPAPTLTSVSVTPSSATQSIGSSTSFTATGTFSDGSTQNVTSLAIWSSSNTSVATVSAAASPQPVACVAAGSSTIQATFSGHSGTAALTCQAVVTSTGGNAYCTPSGTWIGATTDGPASLPTACMNTAVSNTPSPGTTTTTTAANFLATYNAAACGDTIIVTAGTTTSSQPTLTGKHCDNAHWITVKSSGVSNGNFPTEGTRATPCISGVASMPGRLSYPCGSPSVLTAQFVAPPSGSAMVFNGADHIRFIGIEFTRVSTPATVIFTIVDLTSSSSTQTNNIIFDRVWFHGVEGTFPETPSTDTSTTRAIYLAQSNHIALIDSTVSNIYDNGSTATNGNTDSQCIGGGVGSTQLSGWGVYKVVNNHMECGSEGVILGGSAGPAPTPAGCSLATTCTLDVPTDIEIRQNYFFAPMKWDCNTTTNNATGCPNRKNGVEFKTGARILLEANVMENCWLSSQPYCYVFDFAPKNQSTAPTTPIVGMCLSCLVQDFTARYNYGYNYPGIMIAVYSTQDIGCSNCFTLGRRGSVHDNLTGDSLNLDQIPLSGADGVEFLADAGPMTQISIRHNTNIASVRSTLLWGSSTVGTGTSGMDQDTFQDNLMFSPNNGNNGWHTFLPGNGGTGSCDTTGMTMLTYLNTCINGTTPTWTVDHNAFFFPGTISFTGWPTGNLTTASISTVGFATVPPNNARGFPDSGFNPSDYALLASSPYFNAGSDGKNIGADIQTLVQKISGVRDSGTVLATLFVSPTGNDANSCRTSLAPCLTISHAASLASAGDVVQVASGTYAERVTVTTSGTSGNKITFRGQNGSGCPTTPSSDVNSPTGSRPAPSVTMQGWDVRASFISIDCFKITGNGNAALELSNANGQSDIDFTNNYIDGTVPSVGNGPWVGFNRNLTTLATAPKNINYSRNYIFGTEYGLMVDCQTNCLFQDNELERMQGGPLNTDHDYSRVFGSGISFVHNYMHGNRIADCADPVNRDCHIDCWQTWNIGNANEAAMHITLDRNVCFNAHEGIIARDTTVTTVGGYISHFDWKITNNVIGHGPIGDSMPWVAVLDHVGQIVMDNNTCTEGVVGIINGSQATEVKDNIFYDMGFQPYGSFINGNQPGSILATATNLLYESGRTYTGFSGDILNQNPLFVNQPGDNWRLTSASPARDTGVGSATAIDLDGKTRPQGSANDIGAYEF